MMQKKKYIIKQNVRFNLICVKFNFQQLRFLCILIVDTLICDDMLFMKVVYMI